MLVLQKAAQRCIEAIKAAAAAANTAAAAAVAKGASRDTVISVARVLAPTASVSLPSPRPGFTTVVETRTPKVVPGGAIVPGDDAAAVEIPASLPAEPGDMIDDVADVVADADESAAGVIGDRGLPGWAIGLGLVGVGLLAWRAIKS